MKGETPVRFRAFFAHSLGEDTWRYYNDCSFTGNIFAKLKTSAVFAALVFGLAAISSSGAARSAPSVKLRSRASEHTATLLQNGKVLLVGGQSRAGVNLSSVELYDPAAGSAVAAASLSAPRAFHTATLLADGSVLSRLRERHQWRPRQHRRALQSRDGSVERDRLAHGQAIQSHRHSPAQWQGAGDGRMG